MLCGQLLEGEVIVRANIGHDKGRSVRVRIELVIFAAVDLVLMGVEAMHKVFGLIGIGNVLRQVEPRIVYFRGESVINFAFFNRRQQEFIGLTILSIKERSKESNIPYPLAQYNFLGSHHRHPL